MKPLILSLFSLAAFAADAPKPLPVPANPLKDMRADIAIAQRDFVLAKADAEAAQTRFTAAQKAIGTKYDEAGAACKTINLNFDPNAIACIVPASATSALKEEPKK